MARRAKSEDAVKTVVDEVVAKHAINDELQPVLAALAKSTPPNTEARMASHYNMRMSYLVERAREQLQLTHDAWSLVDSVIASCGGKISTATTGDDTTEEHRRFDRYDK